MYINVFGELQDPVIVLIHPTMLTGEQLYQLFSPYFTGKYCFIAPDQGGHGKAGNYISADDEYAGLKQFLIENNVTKVKLVYGASLGVTVAYRLFLDPSIETEYGWFDGAAFSNGAPLWEWLAMSLFRREKKKQLKKHTDALSMLKKMYGPEGAVTMTKNFDRLTLEDLEKICHNYCSYRLRKLTADEQSRLHIDFGEKDFGLKRSKKSLPVYMPDADIKIRKGYAHCGYMSVHTEDYIREIESFIKSTTLRQQKADHGT